MNQTLRILHLEDNPVDALLTRDQLKAHGVSAQIKHVSGRGDFEQALRAETWDLILSDYHLPNFTGLEALELVRRTCPETPFILMSGTIGEQAAIESLKAGATDYILKQNRERLPAAVRRAVMEAGERRRREAAEVELRQSERQYRLLFQGNPHSMWVFDLESLAILEVNEAAVQQYGFSAEEFQAMTMSDLRVQGRPRAIGTTGGDEESQGVIWRHRRKNGGVMDMEIIWRPMAFRGRLAALAMATDVTARLQTAHHNAVFGKLSHQLGAVTIASTAAMFICEAADELFHWDDFSLELYTPATGEVASLLAITTVDGQRVEIPATPQPKAANALIHRVIARGAELVSADESGGRASTTMIVPIRKGETVIGVLFLQSRKSAYTERDLHTLQTLADQCSGALERVRAEEELRHTQRRFRELFENSPDAILVEDLAGRILDANRRACDLHGLSPEALVGKNAIEDLVPGERRELARQQFRDLATGEITGVEAESLRADGRIVPVEIRAGRIDYEGQPALLFHVRDVTERRRIEQARQNSETLFRSVWENSVDGMRLTDQNGIIIAVNSAYCHLVGMTSEQLEGKPFTVVYSAVVDWEKLLRTHRENFATGRLSGKRARELTLQDNREVVFEIADSFVESLGERRLLLSLFRDITSQRKLEEQLRQAQKMEAIGQLAGGIAHDFNNILTVILGHASLLTMQKLDPKALASASQIKLASERAASLTRQLLAFGRKQISNPRPIDLNQLVSNMSEMLTRLLGEDISLQITLSGEPVVVEADQSMMEQIVLNLSVNSRDAMPQGGKLNIRIERQTIDEQRASQILDAKPGKYVCISHSDSGCGIPSENLGRIFEPFFTTKELGKGTGLGLATVFGIVKQHQGWVEVDSHLGTGTTFRVYLPLTNLSVSGNTDETQFRRRGGSETILVVEDERDLRDLVTRVLRHEGYRVFEAVDGNNALKIWSEYKQEIDLLFTDIIMPGGINGRQLAEKLWEERPELKVIFSSGYGADTLGKNFKIEPHFNYLQKPYEPNRLAQTVRNCLDAEPVRA